MSIGSFSIQWREPRKDEKERWKMKAFDGKGCYKKLAS